MSRQIAQILLGVAWAVLGGGIGQSLALAGRGGQLEISVVDRESGEPLACRMHLKNAANRPQKGGKAPFWNDHFAIGGKLTLKLPPGNYSFEIERGPEYLVRTGHFSVEDFAEGNKTVDLKRFADMSQQGWWSGDLNVQRPLKDIELLMQADDLHVASIITWTNQKSQWTKNALPAKELVRFANDRYYQVLGGADTRSGGTLLLHGLSKPLELPAKGEFPPLLMTADEAHAQGPSAWVDAEQAFAWDLPVLVAHGKIDSIQLASSRLCRSSVISDEAGGKPRDKQRFAGASGVGRWTEAIYYHLLNCSLRIPPTAGSGSGAAPNPVGYNRVYVHVDGAFSYEKWWDGLRAGQVVVTNGPLIRPTVDGKLPGYVFQADAGKQLDLEIALTLSTRDKIHYLEIVQDGRVVNSVPLEDWNKAGGKLPHVRFTESGWFLVRAVTDVQPTYRFASTGPYYVQIGYQPRISKGSAQFFLDWVNERIARLKLPDPEQMRQVTELHVKARDYWHGLVSKANAE